MFVHGILGSPTNWSVMIDELTADPRLRARFQFLTFGYDTLQSITDSGRELLEALIESRRTYDPEGRDDSFDQVVLVGHSLGGLVAKTVANVPCPPPDAHGRPAGPRVGRVIFVATPHRGAPVDHGAVRSAGTWFARVASPSNAARQAEGGASAPGSQTSVEQLTWDHPLLRDLDRARAVASVPAHSIIAALRDPNAERATDGVVPVASARLRNARSELVVRTHHGCLAHAEVVQEVRRILSEHADEAARLVRAEPPALLQAPAVQPDREPRGDAARTPAGWIGVIAVLGQLHQPAPNRISRDELVRTRFPRWLLEGVVKP